MTRDDMVAWAKARQGVAHANKTVCATAVLSFFHLDEKAEYLHTLNDIIKTLHDNGYTVIDRGFLLCSAKTVGRLRTVLRFVSTRVTMPRPYFWLVRVGTHVILLDGKGMTIVDTNPRKRDRRTVSHLYSIHSTQHLLVNGRR